MLANLYAFPGNENITEETDLTEILNAAKELETTLNKKYEKAKRNYKQAEEELNAAIEADLTKRINTSFADASDKICQEMQDKVQAETGVAFLGLKNGKMSEKSVNDVLDLSPAKSSPAAAPAKPTVANFTKTQTPATTPARRVSPLQENSMDSNPFEKYENTSSKGGNEL